VTASLHCPEPAAQLFRPSRREAVTTPGVAVEIAINQKSPNSSLASARQALVPISDQSACHRFVGQPRKVRNTMLVQTVEIDARKPHDLLEAKGFEVGLAELMPFMRALSRSLTGKRELAEDLCQEAMASAWQARQSFTPGTNLKAWLCTILRNEFYSHQRRAWRQVPWAAKFADTISAPAGAQQSAIDLCDAASAMNALPDPQRESLILVGICGFSYVETALLLGSTLGTVKSRVARGRDSLQDILNRQNLGRIELRPANRHALNKWLTQLEQLRFNGCRTLDSGDFDEFRRAHRMPKMSVRCLEPVRKTRVCGVEAKGSTLRPCTAAGWKEPLPANTNLVCDIGKIAPAREKASCQATG